MQALRIWREHGPARHSGRRRPPAYPVAAAAVRNNYALPYRALRRLLALSEARGYEPETSQPRLLFALLGWWFEPLERQRRRSPPSQGRAGSAGATSATRRTPLPPQCAPCSSARRHWTTASPNSTPGLAFVRRIGSGNMVEVLETYQWVIDALRGERPTATGAAVSIAGFSDTPATVLLAHSIHAMAAAIFGDQESLERHTAEAVPLVSASPTEYPGAVARALRGLALAGQIRATDGAARDTLLSELDEMTRWLATHADDAPRLPCTCSDCWRPSGRGRSATSTGVSAVSTWPTPRQPMPTAVAPGLDHRTRGPLLFGPRHRPPRIRPAGPGAAAVCRLGRDGQSRPARLGLPDPAPPQDPSAAQRNTRSLMIPWPWHGQTHRQHRNDRSAGHPVDVTGAELRNQHRRIACPRGTGPRRHDRRHRCSACWCGMTSTAGLAAPSDRRRGGATTSDTAPMSVLRYVERTREPLVVPDATRDDRFARDPYFADADCCSLLAVPILSRGILRALLLLENRLMRGAFTAERLTPST